MAIERKNRAKSIVPVSSMADIAFLLLIFFMLSSIMDMEQEIPLQLPESMISVHEPKKYFNVWINRQGEYFFDNKKNELCDLAPYASHRISQNPETRVLIRADREIPYRYVNNALEVLRQAGLHNIVLVSGKRDAD